MRTRTPRAGFGLLGCLCVVGLCTGSATAQARFEYQIVERTGQTLVDPTDNVLDFAVRVRVTNSSTAMYAGGGLMIQMPGESQASGMLARGIISNTDGTYSSALGVSAPGTLSGVAASYRYLIGLNSAFNGGINANVGPALHNPAIQDIVGISPFPGGDGLVNTPGLFTFDPNTGEPIAPAGNTVPQAIGNQYFGARGNWIDIYRFRYTVTNFTPRTVPVNPLPDGNGKWFSQLSLVESIWGAQTLGNDVEPSRVTNFGTTFQVIPAPASALALGFSALVIRRRRA